MEKNNSILGMAECTCYDENQVLHLIKYCLM